MWNLFRSQYKPLSIFDASSDSDDHDSLINKEVSKSSSRRQALALKILLTGLIYVLLFFAGYAFAKYDDIARAIQQLRTLTEPIRPDEDLDARK